MTTAAERIAAFATALEYDDIPSDVVEAAKLHVLDTLGCGLAASALGIATEGRTAMAELGGEPQASVIGLDATLPAPSAAFANAMLCHGLDFDDTHSDSVAHVSAVVVPAAAADRRGARCAWPGAADRDRRRQRDRHACRAWPLRARFHKRGFHPTADLRHLRRHGGRRAPRRLRRARRHASALGIAGSFAGGLFAYLEDGTATKPMHPAWAAHGALLAARLASLGAEGPPSVLEGRFGLYHAFLGAEQGEIDIDGQLADLGERWETPRIAYKPYPACHFMHGSLGSTASLLGDALARRDRGRRGDDPGGRRVARARAGDAKIAPRTEYEGKFSLQYSTAAMLVHGRVGVQTYTEEALADPATLELAKRVRYETKDYPTYPAAFPGGVRIRTRDGRTLEADFPYQQGGPENPMSADEVRAKFRENALLALSADAVDALEAAVLGLDEQESVRSVFPLLAGERVPA